MKDFFKKIFTKENFMKFFFSFVWLAVLVFIIDIVTKWVFVKHFNYDPISFEETDRMITIIPGFLYISLGLNEGMAWSLFSGTTGKIVLAFVSGILGVGFIIYYVKAYKKLNNLVKISLILMIAGALGNFIDRAFYWNATVGFSGVIDWIQVYFGKDPFPTFNIADSSLVIGAILLIIQLIIDSIKESRAKAKAGEYKYSPEQLEKMKKDEGNQSK